MATVRELEEELRRLMKMGLIDYGTELAVVERPGGYALGYWDARGGLSSVTPVADGLPATHAADELLREAEAQVRAEDLAGAWA